MENTENKMSEGKPILHRYQNLMVAALALICQCSDINRDSINPCKDAKMSIVYFISCTRQLLSSYQFGHLLPWNASFRFVTYYQDR